MSNTKVKNCASCGADAETGYNGDDFAMNIKRARCSRSTCANYFTLVFVGDGVLLTESIPNVDEWNSAQGDIAEGMSLSDAWERARPR